MNVMHHTIFDKWTQSCLKPSSHALIPIEIHIYIYLRSCAILIITASIFSDNIGPIWSLVNKWEYKPEKNLIYAHCGGMAMSLWRDAYKHRFRDVLFFCAIMQRGEYNIQHSWDVCVWCCPVHFTFNKYIQCAPPHTARA